MPTIASVVKEFLIPGSSWFLLIGVSVSVVLLAGPPPLRGWGQRVLVLLTAMYWVMSIPMIVNRLAPGVRTRYAATAQEPTSAAQAVVVLGNGVHRYKVGEIQINTLAEESAFTVIEAVRLYRTLGAPLVIVSGGVSHSETYKGTEADVMRDALVAQGVSSDRIVMEGRSGTTREQAMYIAPILRERGIDRFALVTSSIHMPRASAIFRSQALTPIPAPSAYGSEETENVHSPWRPSAGARTLSERVVYEDIGLLYYWIRGWLPSAAESPKP